MDEDYREDLYEYDPAYWRERLEETMTTNLWGTTIEDAQRDAERMAAEDPVVDEWARRLANYGWDRVVDREHHAAALLRAFMSALDKARADAKVKP